MNAAFRRLETGSQESLHDQSTSRAFGSSYSWAETLAYSDNKTYPRSVSRSYNDLGVSMSWHSGLLRSSRRGWAAYTDQLGHNGWSGE